ncbi:MAG: HDOD domain-containing protein [Deltaproteobacteria bacterium]|nr:HDOD domain-containing protein [Deltaproteobacteria bacterium]
MTQEFVRGIRYLPTLPTVLNKIMELLNDDRSTASDMEAIIEPDQALCSKILAVANSAYYGFRYKILTVKRATVALGYDEIKNICLGASLMGFLHPSNFRDRTYAEQLWLHSIAVAETTRILESQLNLGEGGASFTAGLLHDLGKVVLAAFYPEEVQKMFALKQAENLTYRQAETAHGTDHARIGKSLAEHWDLPPVLAEVLGYHHEFHSGLVFLPMVAAVHTADYLARSSSIGDSGNTDPPELKPRALQILGLTPQGLEKCREELLGREEAILGLWTMLLGAGA